MSPKKNKQIINILQPTLEKTNKNVKKIIFIFNYIGVDIDIIDYLSIDKIISQ